MRVWKRPAGDNSHSKKLHLKDSVINLNDLLVDKGIAPQSVLVLRHRPIEPALNKMLPSLAADEPEVFNAYQQLQGPKVESVMKSLSGVGYLASFIAHGPEKALFVGLYSIGKTKSLTQKEYWQVPAHAKLKSFGMRGFADENPSGMVQLFELTLTDFYAHWKGKLIVDWPPPERVWCRRAHKNNFSVAAVLEESALVKKTLEWDQMNFNWDQLDNIPNSWKSALSQWRGIYYIFDISDGKGYVGSAYGESNILGRWLDYAARGHGGNRLLRHRDPRNFRFTILQRVSPDMNAADVVALENSWKQRLHTRAPHGLNEN